MNPFLTKCRAVCEAEGWPDMWVEFNRAGSMAWIKGPKCDINKIDIQDNLKDTPDYAFAMFLHELAHHKYAKEGGQGHTGRFADLFTELVGKYMTTRPTGEQCPK